MKPFRLSRLCAIPLLILLLRGPSSSAGTVEPFPLGGPLHFRPPVGGGGAADPQQEQGPLGGPAFVIPSSSGQPAREQRPWTDIATADGGCSEATMRSHREGVRDLRADADHGIQEPLSFYGNVSERDPPSIPKVPGGIYGDMLAAAADVAAASAACLCRRSVVAAATGPLLQPSRCGAHGLCFRVLPSLGSCSMVTLDPSLQQQQKQQQERKQEQQQKQQHQRQQQQRGACTGWSPLVRFGAVACLLRLSLVEPRGGLLLSQLRSAWEVCCLHCFMLLMLHLLGGPDRALLLVQQQHRLPSAETIDRMLRDAHDTKSSDQRCEGLRGAATMSEEGPRHLSAQSSSNSSSSSSFPGAPQVQLSGTASIQEPAAPPNSTSCSSSSSRLATVKLLASRRWRRGLSAPDVLLSRAAAAGAPAAAAASAGAGAAATPSREVCLSGAPEGLKAPRLSLHVVAEGPSEHELAAVEEGASSCKSLLRSCPESSSPSAAARLKVGLRKRLVRKSGSKRLSQRCARLAEACACKARKQAHEHPSTSPAPVTSSLISSSSSSTVKQRSFWLRCRDTAHRHRLKVLRSPHGGFRGFHRGPLASAATPPLPAAADAADAMPDQEPFSAALPDNIPVTSSPADAAAAAAPAASAAAETLRSLPSERQHQQQQQQYSCCSSSGLGGEGAAAGADAAPEGCSSAAAAVASSSSSKADPSLQQQQQQHQYVVRMGSSDGGGGPALTCSTCSSPRTPDGSCRCFCMSDSKKAAHADWGFVLEVVEDGKKQLMQQQLLRGPAAGAAAAAAAAAPAAAAQGMPPKGTDAAGFRRIWFVPPLCCFAWKSKPRAFSAWDLRMSYRCLLPFTILKLLRLLLCYLLPPLMSLGDSCKGSNSAAAAEAAATPVAAVAAAHVDHQGHQQHLLQRLLQLCCFLSLVLAMWGLAVVFVATRNLLRPFRIGWKFTCLKVLVFFIQVLELAAELFKPRVSSDADAAAAAAGAAAEPGLDPAAAEAAATAAAEAAATAAAHKVYIFTFLELLGSALCALMALWAFRADELLLAHRRLLLLQQYLLPASAEGSSSSEGEGEGTQKQSLKRKRGFAAFARRSFRPLFLKN
ncbi:hypothetical protein Esti_005308 [Eimeria stiedai]